MKRLKSLILFFISFNLEVRVKAETRETSELLQKPEQCLSESSKEECFFSTVQGKKSIEFKGLKMNLFEGSLSKKDEDQISVLKGDVGLVFLDRQEIGTLYGGLVADKNTQLWLSASDHEMKILCLTGKAYFKLGSRKVELLPKFKFSVWKTTGTGHPEYSVPVPVQSEEYLKIKLSFYDEKEPKKEFIESLKEDREELAQLTEKSSQLYQKIADRHMASLEDNDRLRKRKESEEKEKKLQLKRLYFEKVFER